MRRQRDHAIATPPSLISRLAKATARAEVFWVEARKASDFKIFAPHLEEVVKLVRDKAALLGQARGLPPYDALVDEFTPGHLDRRHRHDLQGAVAQASRPHQSGHRGAGGSAPMPFTGKFTAVRQRAARARGAEGAGLSRSIAAGSMRASIRSPRACPATSASPRASIRIDPFSGLLGARARDRSCHVRPRAAVKWRDQPVGRDRGLALEESQSLLFEMNLCRSRAFVTYLKPLLDKYLQ